MDLQPTFECQRGALHIGLERAAGARGTTEPTTRRLVADVATEGETLIADLALRHDDSSWEMKRHSIVDTLRCDTLMLNNTIPDHGWQLQSTNHGRCTITQQALAGMVLYWLNTCPEVSGIGSHAVPLNHVDAWQEVIIPHITHITIPVTIAAADIRADVVQRIHDDISQQLNRWVGAPVTVEVVVVATTPPVHKG